MNLQRTDADRQKLISQINTMKKEGKPIEAACKELGISYQTYYNWVARSKTAKKPKIKAKPRKKQDRYQPRFAAMGKRPEPTMTVIPPAAQMPGQLMLLIGSPEQILTAMRSWA